VDVAFWGAGLTATVTVGAGVAVHSHVGGRGGVVRVGAPVRVAVKRADVV